MSQNTEVWQINSHYATTLEFPQTLKQYVVADFIYFF